MVVYKVGNLLESTDAQIICHQVNCLGVMGAGIAKSIKAQYPECYRHYRNFCRQKGKEMMGKVMFFEADGRIIANIFGQENIGRGVQTDYAALEAGIKVVYQKAKRENKTVGFPYKIGCGLAGGDWNKVKEMIEQIFNDEIECYVYSLVPYEN